MSSINAPRQNNEQLKRVLRANYHKTAIGGSTSRPTLNLFRWLDRHPEVKGKIKTVLDLGAGRGRDRKILSKHFQYFGFDPHPAFGHLRDLSVVDRRFDLVACNYVLNVIIHEDRQVVINQLIKFLKSGSMVLIGVRKDKDAIKPNWKPFYNGTTIDGHVTSRNTFQHFFTDSEISREFEEHAKILKLDSRGAYLLLPKEK